VPADLAGEAATSDGDGMAPGCEHCQDRLASAVLRCDLHTSVVLNGATGICTALTSNNAGSSATGSAKRQHVAGWVQARGVPGAAVDAVDREGRRAAQAGRG